MEEPIVTVVEEKIRRIRELEKEEPLLQENPRRFVMFPIEHSDIWQFYKKAEGQCPARLFSALYDFWINIHVIAPCVNRPTGRRTYSHEFILRSRKADLFVY